MVAAGGLLYAVGFGAVGLASAAWSLAATTLVWSVGEVFIATNWRVYVAAHSPSSHRARVSSALQLVFGAGFVFGPLLAGRVATRFGLPFVWVGCLGVGLGAALGLYVFARTERREKPTAAP